MPSAVSTPQTGVARYRQLVELERIARELHSVAVAGTGRVRSEVPEAYQDWATDLRRGRLRIGGGFLRFLDILARRQDRNAARALALQVLDLLTDAVDVVLPRDVTQEPTPSGTTITPPSAPTLVPTLHPAHPTGRVRAFLTRRGGRGGQAA